MRFKRGWRTVMNEAFKDIDFLMVISGRKQKEEILVSMSENGGRVLNIMYGKGSVKAGNLMDALGFVPEENKVVITCLLQKKKSGEMLKMLTDKFNFDKPNTGIAFTIPVDKLSF